MGALFIGPHRSCRHCERCVYGITVSSHSSCAEDDALISIPQMAKWGSESLSNSPEITQLVSGRAGVYLDVFPKPRWFVDS